LWSLTLIIWPLIIFIIVAVTRNQYPPLLRDACYVGPRNLPSTGFFPFLQTLMCNTDSTCHNKSHLVDPTASKTSPRSSRNKRSDSLAGSPLADMIQGNFNFSLPPDAINGPAELIQVLNNILGPSHPGTSNNVSFINGISTTPLENQETLNKMLETVTLLKRAVCTITLPMINQTSPHLSDAVVTFCKSNNTLLEASISTLNKILMELMLAKPNETMTTVGMAVLAFNQLQNHTSLWETLLAIPKLFSSGSVDQALSTTEALLTNIQGALRVIQSNFPEVGASLSTVHPVLVGGINLLRYVQNWPGKDVSIPLGEVITLQNDSLSDMVKRVLQEVQIPLDKAIALTLDKDMVRSCLCDNSSNPMWLTAACNTGTVGMILRWVSPDLVAKQALLAWSRHVASHDLSFAKGLLHSLMGGVSSGGQGRSNITGAQGSIDTQPQNIEEELLFLSMVDFGEKLEKSQLWPGVKNYFHVVYWILNYKPGVTTPPANCSADIFTSAINCNTGLNWPQFAKAMAQALMSPNQDVLVNCLKGTVNLLQHLYGNQYKQLAGAYLKQQIKGGDALSASLVNLMQKLDAFVHKISMLPDENISNPSVLIPLVSNLFESTGLKPLLHLLFNDGPLNVSTVLDVASKLGRLNQHLFTFNETDSTMAELESLIKQFFSLESNLTVVVPHVMGHTLLTYSEYFHPDAVARFREALQPFINQTSAGFVEAILSAMELLKKVMDSPDGDPTNIIIAYMQQLEEFVLSMYRLRTIQQNVLPNGQLSAAQITDLHLVFNDFFSLLSPEGLENLTKIGPDAAQNIVIEKFLAFIPTEVRGEAGRFLQGFKALQYHIARCAGGQNCLAGTSEIFKFLDQILDMMLSSNANATITVGVTNSVMGRPEY
ncbi:ATP-binding cassette sub-family A member 12, partial [Nibea albiflora]